MKSIGCVSLGCDKNTTDSEAILGFLYNQGFEIKAPDEADIILVNTCSFILDAKEESEEEIRYAIEEKIMGKAKYIIVAGCLVEREKENLFKQFPMVDGLLGVRNLHEINELIIELEAGKKQVMKTGQIDKVPDAFFHHRLQSTAPHYAYLKIAEGCDNHCTYCIIPDLRGPYHSKSIENIMKEAKILEEKGVKELILVAQDTAPYGKDLYGESKLDVLVKELSTLDFSWIRILYTYPEHITHGFIKEIKENPKVCKYLDIPVQHGANEILRKMNRQVTKEEILEKIAYFRREIPDIVLRTSIIVGFPGETKEDIEILLDFLEEAQFDKLGVFMYSREKGSPSYNMKPQISEEVKLERFEKVMAYQQKISHALLEEKVGQVLPVIIDDYDGEVYIGRSPYDTKDVDGVVFIEGENLEIGNIYPVEIMEATPYDLIGVKRDEPAQ